METQLQRLFQSAEPFDARALADAELLMTFLRGAEFGDPVWTALLGDATIHLAKEFDSRLSLDAGSLCCWYIPTDREAVLKLVSTADLFSRTLTPGRLPPMYPGLEPLLQEMIQRTPMYTGSWCAFSLYVFLEGYFAARRLAGDEAEMDRTRMAGMASSIRNETGSLGPWYRVLDIMAGASGRPMEIMWKHFQRASPWSGPSTAD